MKIKVNKFESESEWPMWVGKSIVKHSMRPFKSGKQTEIPVGLGLNPYTNRAAFVFEDESVIDCYQCKLRV